MKKRKFRLPTAAFLWTEAALYTVFLALDLTGRGGYTVPLKYAGVLLCLAYALRAGARARSRAFFFFLKKEKEPKRKTFLRETAFRAPDPDAEQDWLVPLALALTAGADWFLLVKNDRYLLGVALFLAVQTVYLLRLHRAGAGWGGFLRAVLALGAETCVWALNMASPLNLLAALYFSQLLSNTALAWTLSGRRWRMFALGLTLFVGCDVCVGLFNVLPETAPLRGAASVSMWLFYLPSQVLIALSVGPGQGRSFSF